MCEVECKCNADDRLESIKESLRELTANELFNTALKLSMENQELQAKIAYQDRELREAAGDRERAYLNVDGKVNLPPHGKQFFLRTVRTFFSAW